MNVVLIDAWGHGMPEEKVQVPEFKAPANYKSGEKIAEYIAEKKAAWKASLHSNTSTSRLSGVAISLCEGGVWGSPKLFSGEEDNILYALVAELGDYGSGLQHETTVLVGWDLSETVARIRHAAWRHHKLVPGILHPVWSRKVPQISLSSTLNKLESPSLSFSEASLGLGAVEYDRPIEWDLPVVKEYAHYLSVLADRVLA